MLFTEDDLRYEECRLQTFPPSTNAMSKARRGYVWTEDSAAACHFCGHEDDDAHSCREAYGNVPIELKDILRPPSVLGGYRFPAGYVCEDVLAGVHRHIMPVDEEYAAPHARLESFGGGGRHAVTWAEAGFYRVQGTSCKVRCYHCGLSLVCWDDDADPWATHTYWVHRSCYHLVLMCKASYLDRQTHFTPSAVQPLTTGQLDRIMTLPLYQQIRDSGYKSDLIRTRLFEAYNLSRGLLPLTLTDMVRLLHSSPTPSPSPPSPPEEEEEDRRIYLCVCMKKVTVEQRSDHNIINLCVCCQMKATEIVFLPCLHWCSCSECALRMAVCPMCLNVVIYTLKPVQ